MKKLVRSVENRGPVPLNVGDFAVPFYLSPNQKAELFISDIEQGGTVKTIKDAVIELGGKWPKEFALGYMSYDGYRLYYDTTGYQVCVKDQFEAEAKRMGCINGYRWGVEYPANGKRPDLTDNLMVMVNSRNPGYWYEARQVCVNDWAKCKVFKITDQRYKPADTSYLNAQPQAQGLTHSEEGLTHSAWCKSGRNPPIGTMVDIVGDGLIYGQGETGEVVGYFIPPNGKNLHGVNIVNMSYGMGCFCSENLRPAKTEREKFIEAGCAAMKTQHHTVKSNLGLLFDAGFRGPKVDE